MKAVIFLVVCVAYANSLFICPPKTCSTVRCAAVTAENCEGRIDPKGGYCGCCGSCITQLEEGTSCSATLLLGAPRKVECAQGLHCDYKTRVCKKNTCAMVAGRVKARMEAARRAGSPLLGAHVPDCTGEDFSPKQCTGSKCFCVDKSGDHITRFTPVNVWEASDVDCQCARDQDEYMKLNTIGKMFHCEGSGNYQKIQCRGSACYCADRNGNMLTGEQQQTVHIAEKDKLKC